MQFELFFKVEDNHGSVMKDVTIKIKNGKDVGELNTNEKGEAKAANKFEAKSVLSIDVSMLGYKTITQQITVDERQSKNTFYFKLELKSVIFVEF